MATALPFAPAATPLPATQNSPAGIASQPVQTQSQPATQTPVFRPWQQRVLQLLALGSSVASAMEAVQMAENTFYRTCQRHPEFRAQVDLARGYFAAQIDDATHELEADARTLIHQIILDESIAPSIRLRAALAVLSRKSGAWQPRPIHIPAALPTGIEQIEPPIHSAVENLDSTLDNLDTKPHRELPADLPQLTDTQPLSPQLEALLQAFASANYLDNLDIPHILEA